MISSPHRWWKQTSKLCFHVKSLLPSEKTHTLANLVVMECQRFKDVLTLEWHLNTMDVELEER